MKFGVFYECQIPRPWDDGDERKLFKDALEQVELADRLGIDYAWEVERHFLEEYSHSSAPEAFLAACFQMTKRIRLGHGIVLMPPGSMCHRDSDTAVERDLPGIKFFGYGLNHYYSTGTRVPARMLGYSVVASWRGIRRTVERLIRFSGDNDNVQSPARKSDRASDLPREA